MNDSWTEADLAYFAGILDGEGCLTLSSVRRNDSGSPSMAAHVSVLHTDARLIRWLHTTFGGTVHLHKKHRAHHKQPIVWTLCGAGIEELLTACMPYLRLKQDQAALMLEFRATVIPNTGGADRPRLSTETLARRDEMSARMSILNRKGVAS